MGLALVTRRVLPWPGVGVERAPWVEAPTDPLLSFPCSSMFIRWPGCSLGSHAWILIAMFQLALDLPTCESLGPGPEFRLLPRPPHRPPRLWSFKSGQPARIPAPVWSPRPPRVERGHSHGQMPSPRARRAHRPRDQEHPRLEAPWWGFPPLCLTAPPHLSVLMAETPSPALW